MFKKIFCSLLACLFFSTHHLTFSTPGVFASMPSAPQANQLSVSNMTLNGLKIFPQSPFELDLIFDAPYQQRDDELAMTMVKYFMAALTVPDEDLWVNLSPVEQDRIVPEQFGMTDMGRDLLAQDYVLKQISANLLHPEGDVGRVFWERIYSAAAESQRDGGQSSTSTVLSDQLPDLFHKIWIVPDKASVYYAQQGAIIKDARLKVKLEHDDMIGSMQSKHSSLEVEELMKEVLIPVIEEEINQGKHFEPLRQIYRALILANWYKLNLRNGLIGKSYIGKNRVSGISHGINDAKDQIYAQYLKSFQRGAVSLIREDYDPVTQQLIPRKYFTGGANFVLKDLAQLPWPDSASLSTASQAVYHFRLDAPEGDFNISDQTVDFAELTLEEIADDLKKRADVLAGIIKGGNLPEGFKDVIGKDVVTEVEKMVLETGEKDHWLLKNLTETAKNTKVFYRSLFESIHDVVLFLDQKYNFGDDDFETLYKVYLEHIFSRVPVDFLMRFENYVDLNTDGSDIIFGSVFGGFNQDVEVFENTFRTVLSEFIQKENQLISNLKKFSFYSDSTQFYFKDIDAVDSNKLMMNFTKFSKKFFDYESGKWFIGYLMLVKKFNNDLDVDKTLNDLRARFGSAEVNSAIEDYRFEIELFEKVIGFSMMDQLGFEQLMNSTLKDPLVKNNLLDLILTGVLKEALFWLNVAKDDLSAKGFDFHQMPKNRHPEYAEKGVEDLIDSGNEWFDLQKSISDSDILKQVENAFSLHKTVMKIYPNELQTFEYDADEDDFFIMTEEKLNKHKEDDKILYLFSQYNHLRENFEALLMVIDFLNQDKIQEKQSKVSEEEQLRADNMLKSFLTEFSEKYYQEEEDSIPQISLDDFDESNSLFEEFDGESLTEWEDDEGESEEYFDQGDKINFEEENVESLESDEEYYEHLERIKKLKNLILKQANVPPTAYWTIQQSPEQATGKASAMKTSDDDLLYALDRERLTESDFRNILNFLKREGVGVDFFSQSGLLLSAGEFEEMGFESNLVVTANYCCGENNGARINPHQMPFEDGGLDFVVSMDDFRYLDQLEMVIQERNRVLKKGGKVVFVYNPRWKYHFPWWQKFSDVVIFPADPVLDYPNYEAGYELDRDLFQKQLQTLRSAMGSKKQISYPDFYNYLGSKKTEETGYSRNLKKSFRKKQGLISLSDLDLIEGYLSNAPAAAQAYYAKDETQRAEERKNIERILKNLFGHKKTRIRMDQIFDKTLLRFFQKHGFEKVMLNSANNHNLFSQTFEFSHYRKPVAIFDEEIKPDDFFGYDNGEYNRLEVGSKLDFPEKENPTHRAVVSYFGAVAFVKTEDAQPITAEIPKQIVLDEIVDEKKVAKEKALADLVAQTVIDSNRSYVFVTKENLNLKDYPNALQVKFLKDVSDRTGQTVVFFDDLKLFQGDQKYIDLIKLTIAQSQYKITFSPDFLYENLKSNYRFLPVLAENGDLVQLGTMVSTQKVQESVYTYTSRRSRVGDKLTPQKLWEFSKIMERNTEVPFESEALKRLGREKWTTFEKSVMDAWKNNVEEGVESVLKRKPNLTPEKVLKTVETTFMKNGFFPRYESKYHGLNMWSGEIFRALEENGLFVDASPQLQRYPIPEDLVLKRNRDSFETVLASDPNVDANGFWSVDVVKDLQAYNQERFGLEKTPVYIQPFVKNLVYLNEYSFTSIYKDYQKQMQPRVFQELDAYIETYFSSFSDQKIYIQGMTNDVFQKFLKHSKYSERLVLLKNASLKIKPKHLLFYNDYSKIDISKFEQSIDPEAQIVLFWTRDKARYDLNQWVSNEKIEKNPEYLFFPISVGIDRFLFNPRAKSLNEYHQDLIAQLFEGFSETLFEQYMETVEKEISEIKKTYEEIFKTAQLTRDYQKINSPGLKSTSQYLKDGKIVLKLAQKVPEVVRVLGELLSQNKWDEVQAKIREMDTEEGRHVFYILFSFFELTNSVGVIHKPDSDSDWDRIVNVMQKLKMGKHVNDFFILKKNYSLDLLKMKFNFNEPDAQKIEAWMNQNYIKFAVLPELSLDFRNLFYNQLKGLSEASFESVAGTLYLEAPSEMEKYYSSSLTEMFFVDSTLIIMPKRTEISDLPGFQLSLDFSLGHIHLERGQKSDFATLSEKSPQSYGGMDLSGIQDQLKTDETNVFANVLGEVDLDSLEFRPVIVGFAWKSLDEIFAERGENSQPLPVNQHTSTTQSFIDTLYKRSEMQEI